MRSALILVLMLIGTPIAALADDPKTDNNRSPPMYRELFQFLGVEDAGSSISVSNYTSVQAHRDIDVTTADFSRGWTLLRAFELQRRIGLFHSHGTRTDAPYGVDPDSTASGISAGVAARLYPLDLIGVDRVRPFIEGSAQFLYTPGTHAGFPSGGSGVNGFERAGAGIVIQLRRRLALEATYQWYAHVSNGSGLSPQNPMWNGHGGSIGVRRAF
jgi:hypothetical protein